MKPIQTNLREIVNFYNGAEASFFDNGEYIVYGSNGPIGKSRTFNNENAIIMGRVGAYCGSIEIAKNKFWASDNTIVVKPKSNNSLEYLYYLLITFPLRNYAGGAAQPLLTHTILKAINLKYFKDYKYQQKIASILSAYDDLIDINRRRIRLLEEVARLLFREWFVYFRFPGHEKFKIVDGMPEGWERVHLEYLVETQYGYTETATDEEIGPKFLRGTDINKNSYIDWSAVPYCTEQGLNFEKYALSKDDIVVIRMADPGKVAIIEKNIKAIFASYLVRLKIKPNTPLLPYFLFYKLSNEQYQGFIANASTGSTRQSASAKLLVNFHFVLPPLSLQEMFNDYIIPLRAQMNTLLDQNAALKKARDLLLPRLMSGRIYPVR